MKKQRKQVSEIIRRLREIIDVDDDRCHYCGNRIDATVNHNDYFVLICPECGALSTSTSTPIQKLLSLKRNGTVVDRFARSNTKLL